MRTVGGSMLGALLIALVGCGDDGAGSPRDGGAGVDDGGGGSDAEAGDLLATLYPGDIGIASDPSVVWAEDFEEGSLAAFQARYDQVQGASSQALIADVPGASTRGCRCRRATPPTTATRSSTTPRCAPPTTRGSVSSSTSG